MISNASEESISGAVLFPPPERNNPHPACSRSMSEFPQPNMRTVPGKSHRQDDHGAGSPLFYMDDFNPIMIRINPAI